jgi:hypothetical protein
MRWPVCELVSELSCCPACSCRKGMMLTVVDLPESTWLNGWMSVISLADTKAPDGDDEPDDDDVDVGLLLLAGDGVSDVL